MTGDEIVASLVEMTDEERDDWMPTSLATYIGDRIAAGESREEATTIATSQREASFPGGKPAPGHVLFNVVVDGAGVGVLWMGPASYPPNPSARYVYEVEVTDGLRGRGFGRAAMRAAEEWSRREGATRLSLNVFGFNATARGLYDSLGYKVASTFHGKEL